MEAAMSATAASDILSGDSIEIGRDGRVLPMRAGGKPVATAAEAIVAGEKVALDPRNGSAVKRTTLLASLGLTRRSE